MSVVRLLSSALDKHTSKSHVGFNAGKTIESPVYCFKCTGKNHQKCNLKIFLRKQPTSRDATTNFPVK